MKRILLITKSFETGGIESSMINLANLLSEYYIVDIFVYNPHGPMKRRLNNNINILQSHRILNIMGSSFSELKKNREIKKIIIRVIMSLYCKVINNNAIISYAIKKQGILPYKYDVAIAFHHEQKKHTVTAGFSRILDECVNSKMKLSWIHYDPETIDLDFDYNEKYIAKMDKIVCVSKSVKYAYGKNHPSLKNKLDFCYNVLDYRKINEKSLDDNYEKKEIINNPKNIVCFSACRLTGEKGLVRAIEALQDSFKKNKNLYWLIAGDGTEKNNIINCIKKYDLENQIILLGNLENPYNYMKKVDLIMNVSYHEAAPMVFLEAKYLNTPVFATETLSAREMINDGVEGIICKNTPEDMSLKFLELTQDKAMIKNLKQHMNSILVEENIKSNILNKFENWMEIEK